MPIQHRPDGSVHLSGLGVTLTAKQWREAQNTKISLPKLGGVRQEVRNQTVKAHDAVTMAPCHRVISGEFMVNSTGEALVEVEFPVHFIEKPIVICSFESKEGEPYIPGQMPTGTGQVKDWITLEKPPITRLFTGCVIGVVTTGPTFQKMIGIWQATGRSLMNPAGN